MTTKLLPVVGSRGLYQLIPPFDTLSTQGVEYTCQAVRRLSEMIANNEDPKLSIYTEYGLSDIVYEDDLKTDAYIVSLQSAKGHWLFVPYRYISSYPSGDAVPYRTVMLQFSVAALPVAFDYSDLMDRVSDTIRHTTGVNVESRVTQTSQVTLVRQAIHEAHELNRSLNRTGTTYAEQVKQMEREISRLHVQNTLLTEYIKLNRDKLMI